MRVGCEDKSKDDPSHRPANHQFVSREAALDRVLAAADSMRLTYEQAALVTSAVLGGTSERSVSPAELHERSATLERYRAQLERLKLDPGIAQRTPDWYAARQTMVTASDVAQALGCAKFGNQRSFFQKKCGLPEEQSAFDGSLPPLKWGVMFEPVAQNLYSALNGGSKVHEFGLLRHPTLSFVGASPDGITDAGIMLEIKCPWKRKIVTGEVPMQYYYQIQAQLAVCELDECDYFECEFGEAHQDPLGPTGVVDCEWEDAAKEGRAGAFVESFVREKESSYAYPPADVANSRSPEAITEWAYACATATPASPECPECPSTTQPPKIVWWILRRAANTRVFRDAAFCEGMFSRLKVVWDRTIDYRGDRDRYLSEVGAAVVGGASASADSESARGHSEADAEAIATFKGAFAFVEE